MRRTERQVGDCLELCISSLVTSVGCRLNFFANFQLHFFCHNYIKIFTKHINIISWSVYCRIIPHCFSPTSPHQHWHPLLLWMALKIAPLLSNGFLIQNLLPPRLNLSSRNNSSATGGEASQVGIGNWCSAAWITKWANARECWSCSWCSKKWSSCAVVFRFSRLCLCLCLHCSSLPSPN